MSHEQSTDTISTTLSTCSNRHRLSLILFGAAIFVFWAPLYIYVPTLPVYAERLGAAPRLVGLILASYGFSQLVLRIPLGVLSDRLGRRQPFVLLGFLVTAASCLILAWAPTPYWLLLGRTLAGVSASSWVCATVLFASYFEPQEAVRATSYATFLSAAGQMTSMAIGGRLADAIGWVAPFQTGALIAVAGAALILGVAEKQRTRSNGSSLARLHRVIAQPALIGSSMAALVGQWISQGITFGFVPVYAANVLNATQTQVGLLSTLTQLAYTLAALATSWLAPRLCPRRLLTLGLGLCALATAAVPASRSLVMLAAVRVLSGMGFGFLYPVAMGLSISSVSGEDRASAMGVFQALYAIGMFAGPAVCGWLVQATGLEPMFRLTALLPLGAAAIAVALPWWGRSHRPSSAG